MEVQDETISRPYTTGVNKPSQSILDYVPDIWPSELCSDLKSKKPKNRRRRKNRKQRKKKLSKTKIDVDLRSSKIPNDGRPLFIPNQNVYDWGFLLNTQQPSWVHFQSGWVFVPIAVLNNGALYAMIATPCNKTILYPIVMKYLNV